ncbi:MAG: hypothetical protein ACRD5H_11470 [Nitrososphaerales archaeon]
MGSWEGGSGTGTGMLFRPKWILTFFFLPQDCALSIAKHERWESLHWATGGGGAPRQFRMTPFFFPQPTASETIELAG